MPIPAPVLLLIVVFATWAAVTAVVIALCAVAGRADREQVRTVVRRPAGRPQLEVVPPFVATVGEPARASAPQRRATTRAR